MSEQGCGEIFLICEHSKNDDCGDIDRPHPWRHVRYRCGQRGSRLYVERPFGIIGGVEFITFSGDFWLRTCWFCSVECYQKIPENKKIKFENF